MKKTPYQNSRQSALGERTCKTFPSTLTNTGSASVIPITQVHQDSELNKQSNEADAAKTPNPAIERESPGSRVSDTR
jgi:hypothetical protein